MKTFTKGILAAVCASTLLFTGSAFAAGTTTLTVTGTVTGICKLSTGPYSIPFGTLDPSSTVNAVQSVTISYKCTNGTAASSIKVNTAASPTTVNIVSGANTLPVDLTWTVPATTGTGFAAAAPAITSVITGTVQVANLNAAVAGIYTAAYNIDLLP
jgi:hypothetical protein